MPEGFDENKIAAEFIKQNMESFLAAGKGILRGAADIVRLRIDKTYKAYISCLLDRHSKAKSFFIRSEPVLLHSFYVPLAIKLLSKEFKRPDMTNLSAVAPHIVVMGTAGSGKTMFMRHLLLTSLLARAKVPVFIELRQLNQSDDTLLDAMSRNLKACKFQLTKTYMIKALKAGHFVLFFDGFDELIDSKKAAVAGAIQKFAEDYDSNWIVVSSRPDPELEGWQLFATATLQPLTLNRACELIQKLPFDDDIKAKFLADLRSGLFVKHKSFLSNPLLLSIMLLTYEHSAHIPDKLNVFYANAFEALFERHDALKGGFQRRRGTALDIQEFGRVFSAFSLQTYDERRVEFTKTQVLDYLENCKSIANLEYRSGDFLKDALQAVCLLLEDGLSIVFAHRSFQEYFTARFISETNPRAQQKFIRKYAKNVLKDNVIRLLYEIRPDIVEHFYILPGMKQLLKFMQVKRTIGLTHYMRYLRESYSAFWLFEDQVSAMLNPTSRLPFFELARFMMSACRHLAGGVEVRSEARDAALLVRKYGRSREEPTIIQMGDISYRDAFVKDLAVHGGFWSLKTLNVLVQIQKEILKRNRSSEESLEDILRR